MKNSYYIFLLAILIFNISCKDYLDRTDLSHLTVDNFFKSEADISQFVDGMYNYMMPNPTWDNLDLDFTTDLNALNPSRGDWSGTDISLGSFTSSSASIARYWDYNPIRNAYIFFDKVKEVQMSEASLNLYTGSVEYLLAFRYSIMFKAYESVPLVKEVLSVDKSDIPSSTKEEVFAEALKQVNSSISHLPSLGPQARERGRLTKLCALTLKADMILYAASRFNGAIAGASWQDAANAAQAALAEADNAGYGLTTNFINLFTGLYQPNADIQKEIILEYVRLPKIATNILTNWVWSPRKFGFGVAGFCGTQELVDSYECMDGKPINISPLYDPTHPFKNRDQRLSNTILFPGNIAKTIDSSQDWLFNSLNPTDGNEENKDYMLTSYNPRDASLSGYINIKYWDKDLATQTWQTGYTSFIVYRYAELLLMYAEAKNEATGPDASVYSAISKVRQRSNMPPVTATTHPAKSDVQKLVRNERIVELVGEGKRYWDVRRWGIGDKVQNKEFKSLHISKFNSDGTFNSYVDKIWVRTNLTNPSEEAQFVIPDGAAGGRLMTTGVFNSPKYYVWPIPLDAIQKSNSGALKQNPLWQ
jgi:starch-binding outer membrane protein, SusD/RagB family